MKLTAELTEKFCAMIRQGITQERAAWSCGVDDATIWKWKHRGQVELSGKYRDFWEAYRKAEGDCEVLALSLINKAARDGDWRAMAWRLERMNPDRYGQKIRVTIEERKRMASDLLSRLRARLDGPTFERVSEALLEACADADCEEPSG